MEKVKLNRHFISDIFFYQEGPGVRKWQFKDSGVKLINVGNINNGKIDLSSTKINISEEEAYGKYSHFLIDEGDLLIACSGIVVENFHNKIAFIKKEHLPLCLNTSTMRFKELPEKKGDLNFLKYFLQTNDFKSQLRKLITGSAQLNFGPSHIRKIEIPLPSLATQQRIAAILDQADAIIQNNRAIVQKYDALTQSLFLDMFGDPVKNEKGWEMKTLKDFGTSRLGKMLDGKKIIGNNLKPYLRNSNVQWFRFELNDLLKMDFDEKDKVEFSLKVGDILMCEGGEIGRCAIWKDEIEDCYFQKAIHRIRLNDKYVLPEYFVYMFKNIADNGGLDEFKSAATISHLTGEKLKKMRMPIPSITLQNLFAERVAVIESQKQKAQLELAKSEELFQSLLQRAFKGELS